MPASGIDLPQNRYAIAAIMPQVDGGESRERHRIPLYGLQCVYVRAAGFQAIRTNAYCDKGENIDS